MAAGLNEFNAAVRGWFDAVEKAAEDAAVGLATKVFEKALAESPQYSGSYTGNWKLSYGSIDTSFEFDPLGTKGSGPIYQRGSGPAQGYAHAHGMKSPGGFKLGQSIFVSNSTKSANEINRADFHANMFTNLAWRIEEGKIQFRPVNEGADHVGTKSLNFVAHRFQNINKASLAILRRVGV